MTTENIDTPASVTDGAINTDAGSDKLEIYRMLVLSTAHMTEHDDQLLTKHGGWTVPYGYLMHISEETIDDLATIGCSAALVNVLKFATSKRCDYVRFDSDGQTIKQLPTFDWP